jgi:hypothetical protein
MRVYCFLTDYKESNLYYRLEIVSESFSFWQNSKDMIIYLDLGKINDSFK